MRRFLFATALILMLGLVAYSQRPTNANSSGDIMTYNPIVFGAAPTPTATATIPVPTATPTLVPQGTGVFKKDGNTRYRNAEINIISACGFILFWDGRPAYGGSDGFRAEACLDDTNRCQYYSPPVDPTGYYELPIVAGIDGIPDSGGGSIHVLQGRDLQQVSEKFRFDFEDVGDDWPGVTVRMDFIECRVGDPSSVCNRDNATSIGEDGSYLIPAPVTEDSPRTPTLTCPE